MKFTQRLEGGARKVVRTTRAVGRGLAPGGPRLTYARVLDGEHLWVAVPADEGRPALRDAATGAVTGPADAAPGEDPAYASARWRLTDVLPESDDAEALLVVLDANGGKPTQLRPPLPAPASNLRVPPTPDGRWRFQLVTDDRGFLRVRRTPAARVARLMDIVVDGTTVRLTFAPPEPGLEPRLHFMKKNDTVVSSIDIEASGADLVATITANDIPAQPGGYRVAVGSPADPVSVVRLANDVHVREANNVLLPHLLDPVTETVVGRFLFSAEGVLRVRKDDTEETR